MKKLFIIFLLMFVLVLSAVLADEGKQITVATEEWEDYTNADGTGLYFDILRGVYAPLGYELNIQIVPYARSVKMVEDKTADIVIGPYEDEVEDVIYPKSYFDADKVSALMLSNTESTWRGEKSLKNKKVAYIRGYELTDYIEVPFEAIEVDNRETAFKLLVSGRIDFFLEDAEVLSDTLAESKTYKASDFSIKNVKLLPIYMCFSDNPKGKELSKVWEKQFQKILKSGELREIFVKWDSEESFDTNF